MERKIEKIRSKQAALQLISSVIEQNKYNTSNLISLSDRVYELENSNLLSGTGISDNYHIKIDKNKAVQSSLIEINDESFVPIHDTIYPQQKNKTILNINTKTTLSHVSDVTGVIEGEIIRTQVVAGDVVSINTKKYLHLSTDGVTTNNQNKGLTITSNGNIGIGVTNPEETLEIDGNIQLDTGGSERNKIVFYDKQNDHKHAEIDALGDGDGGSLVFYTKINGQQGSSAVTEKLRINNIGAIGVIGIQGPDYGNSGQVLSSRGNVDSVRWVDQTDTTYTQGDGISINSSNVISLGQTERDAIAANTAKVGVPSTVGTWGNYLYNNYGEPTWSQLPAVSVAWGDVVNKPSLLLANPGQIAGCNYVHTTYHVGGSNYVLGMWLGLADNDYWLHVINNGYSYKVQTWGGHSWSYSDRRLKYNIRPIGDALADIRLLQPYTYQTHTRLLTDEERTSLENGESIEPDTWQLNGATITVAGAGESESGVMAQDIEQIPNLVHCIKEENGRKMIDYNSLFIHAVKAIKELDAIIQQQQTLIHNLTSRIEALESN